MHATIITSDGMAAMMALGHNDPAKPDLKVIFRLSLKKRMSVFDALPCWAHPYQQKEGLKWQPLF